MSARDTQMAEMAVGIGPCKGTVALISARAKVPIQTVFIETASPYLSKGWPLFRRPDMPISYRIRLGRRFEPPQKASVFTHELEAYFAEALRDSPNYLAACPTVSAPAEADQSA